MMMLDICTRRCHLEALVHGNMESAEAKDVSLALQAVRTWRTQHIHTHTGTHKHAQARTHTHTHSHHMQGHMYECTYSSTHHMQKQTHVSMQAMHICTKTNTDTHTHTRTRV